MKGKSSILGCLTAISILIIACTNDKLDAPPVTCNTTGTVVTYDNQIETILTSTCAYVGCHISGSNGGGAPGNYFSYTGLVNIINSGGFENRVITQRQDPTLGMPPDYASGPQNLTTEQLDLIQCWIDAGYPEN